LASLNKFTAIGNLGQDPALRFTPEGKAVVRLSVPANDPVFNKQTQEWQDNTLWVSASLWEDQAERVAEKARKGDLVYIEGPIRLRSFDRQDGTQGVSVDMRRVNKFVLLERRARDDAETSAPAAVREAADDLDIDDLPF